MVTMPTSLRNLTQHAENISPALAIAIDAMKEQAAPTSGVTNAAVDALSDLLNDTAAMGDNPLITSVSQATDRYETYGSPDLLQQLFALIRRPVGQGVHYRTRTATVDTPSGPVTTSVQEAEYYDRPLTPEERMYLDQQDRLHRLRPKPGDIDWITKPDMRTI